MGGFALNAGYVLTNRNTGNIYIFLFLFRVNVLTVFCSESDVFIVEYFYLSM